MSAPSQATPAQCPCKRKRPARFRGATHPNRLIHPGTPIFTTSSKTPASTRIAVSCGTAMRHAHNAMNATMNAASTTCAARFVSSEGTHPSTKTTGDRPEQRMIGQRDIQIALKGLEPSARHPAAGTRNPGYELDGTPHSYEMEEAGPQYDEGCHDKDLGGLPPAPIGRTALAHTASPRALDLVQDRAQALFRLGGKLAGIHARHCLGSCPV